MAGTKKGAKLLLDRITIAALHRDNNVQFNTVIGGSDTTHAMQPDERCMIHYYVFLPDNLPLTLKNQFGNITIDKYSGALEVDEKFGSFMARALARLDVFSLQGGSVSIGTLKEGNLLAKAFENFRIDSVLNNVRCSFLTGKTLDIGLANGRYSFNMQSSNIQRMHVHFAENLSADVTLDAVLSKVLNRSSIVLKEDTTGPRRFMKFAKIDSLFVKERKQNDTAAVILQKKKLDALERLMKIPVRYKGKSGDGSALINIKGSFSAIDFDSGGERKQER
jgi:hypothetical protein